MGNSILTSEWDSPFGKLKIGVYADQICMIDWQYRKLRNAIDSRISTHLKTQMRAGHHPLMDACIDQIQAYAAGKRKAFDLPLCMAGSAFQISVWEALEGIPYGTTLTYLDLSQQLGNEKAIRAVASANGANAISIVIPCHRIIGSDGSLVGYAGGIKTKQKLLELEGALTTNQTSLF